MRVIVVGATGTIGRAVADALATDHEVVRASRRSEVKVDLEDPGSVAELFRRVRDVDAVVSCAGDAVSPPWVSETLVALKMDPSPGLPAATVARAYVAAVTGRGNGETLGPAAFA